MNRLTKLSFSFFLFLIINVDGIAQCVMCSATIEANKVDGGNTGAGINAGVGYLSLFPYLIFIFFGYIFYSVLKKEKLKKQQEENQ